MERVWGLRQNKPSVRWASSIKTLWILVGTSASGALLQLACCSTHALSMRQQCGAVLHYRGKWVVCLVQTRTAQWLKSCSKTAGMRCIYQARFPMGFPANAPFALALQVPLHRRSANAAPLGDRHAQPLPRADPVFVPAWQHLRARCVRARSASHPWHQIARSHRLQD